MAKQVSSEPSFWASPCCRSTCARRSGRDTTSCRAAMVTSRETSSDASLACDVGLKQCGTKAPHRARVHCDRSSRDSAVRLARNGTGAQVRASACSGPGRPSRGIPPSVDSWQSSRTQGVFGEAAYPCPIFGGESIRSGPWPHETSRKPANRSRTAAGTCRAMSGGIEMDPSMGPVSVRIGNKGRDLVLECGRRLHLDFRRIGGKRT